MSDGFGDWVALFIGRHLPASFTWNLRLCVSLSNRSLGEGLPAIRVTFRDDADLRKLCRRGARSRARHKSRKCGAILVLMLNSSSNDSCVSHMDTSIISGTIRKTVTQLYPLINKKNCRRTHTHTSTHTRRRHKVHAWCSLHDCFI